MAKLLVTPFLVILAALMACAGPTPVSEDLGPNLHTDADGISHSLWQADAETRRCGNCETGQSSEF